MDVIVNDVISYGPTPLTVVLRDCVWPNPEGVIFVFDDELLYYDITCIYRDRKEYHISDDWD